MILTHLGKILKKVLVFVFSYTGVEKTKIKNKSGKVLSVRIEIWLSVTRKVLSKYQKRKIDLRPKAKFAFRCHENVSSYN